MTQDPSAQDRRPHRGEILAGALSALLFVGLRVAGFLKDNELEDQDSIGFLERAQLFLGFDFAGLLEMEATALPLYSLLTAIFSPFTADLEAAARLVSLTASVLTAVAVYLLAARFAGRRAGIAAVFLMAVNPYLIRFSYSAVSEPLYSAIFAWTLYFFIEQLRRPGIRSGLMLGLLGGLAFAARFESIVLFALLPVIQAVVRAGQLTRKEESDTARFIVAYACVLAVLLAPQIWRVSEKMNTLALNGRTVWQAILSSPGNGSYTEKLFGLDYDPATPNVYYLQSHPDALRELTKDISLADVLVKYARRAVLNIQELHDERLAQLVGIPVLAFSVIGFLALLRSSCAPEALVLAAMLCIGLVAPVTNRVNLDHIALVAGPLSMLAGVGIVSAWNMLVDPGRHSETIRIAIVVILFGLATAPYGIDLLRLYTKEDDANSWYDRQAISGAVDYLRTIDMDQRPGVLGAHQYVAHFAGAAGSTAPWTDVGGLVHYMRANGIEYIYVNKHLAEYPFFAEIGSDRWKSSFTLEYSDRNPQEGQQLIYRLKP